MRGDRGSCEHARQLALSGLLDNGCTPLESRVGAHVASYGQCCFQTDTTVQEVLEREYGRKYHRGSIARARRTLSRARFLQGRRLFAGQRVAGMKRGSSHGTTAKYFDWNAIGVHKNPHAKRQRMIQALMAKAEAERAKAAAKARYSAPPPEPMGDIGQKFTPNAAQPISSTDPLESVLSEFLTVQRQRASSAPPARRAGPIEASDRERGPPKS